MGNAKGNSLGKNLSNIWEIFGGAITRTILGAILSARGRGGGGGGGGGGGVGDYLRFLVINGE